MTIKSEKLMNLFTRYLGKKAQLLYRYLLVHKIAPWTFLDDKVFLQYKFLQKI